MKRFYCVWSTNENIAKVEKQEFLKAAGKAGVKWCDGVAVSFRNPQYECIGFNCPGLEGLREEGKQFYIFADIIEIPISKAIEYFEALCEAPSTKDINKEIQDVRDDIKAIGNAFKKASDMLLKDK